MLADETITELRKRFNSTAAQNVTATYLFNVTGEGGGSWLTTIANGNCDFVPVTNGGASGAKPVDCTISIDAQDMTMILDGRLSAMTAAMSGVLAIDGELGLAMQLVPIFFDNQAPLI
jgi:putative sterol carrier protein